MEAGEHTQCRDESRPRWEQARFFRRAGARVRCTLCPHECLFSGDEVGRCHVRRLHAGRMETATRATTVRHLDPVERKPLYHYRPGRRVLTLAAPGCSFACSYCQNHRLSQYGRSDRAPWQAQPVSPQDIVDTAAKEGADVGLSYSEPSLAAELTLELARLGATRGVGVVWKSNGFVTPEALALLAPALAAVNVDLKAAEDGRHRALTGAPLAPVIETLHALRAADVWLEVSTPLIPGFNDDDGTLRRIAGEVAGVGKSVPWHLVRFHPEYRMRGARPTSPNALERAAEIGRAAGLDFVYVERALGVDGRSTACPGCRATVVRRGIWCTEEVRLAAGRCRNCGARVPGTW